MQLLRVRTCAYGEELETVEKSLALPRTGASIEATLPMTGCIDAFVRSRAGLVDGQCEGQSEQGVPCGSKA